jgi:hypothetical protein
MSLDSRGAWTLVEVMVVGLVLVSLMSILFSTLGLVVDAAKSSRCANAQRQLVIGALSYASDHEDGLPATQVYQGATRYMWYDSVSEYLANGRDASGRYAGTVITGCPQWMYDSGNNTSLSYGMNAFLRLKTGLEGDDFSHNRWGGSSILVNWIEFRLSNITNKSTRLYFADTRSFWTGKLDMPSTNTFEQRHRGKTVVAYIDGRTDRLSSITDAQRAVRSP